MLVEAKTAEKAEEESTSLLVELSLTLRNGQKRAQPKENPNSLKVAVQPAVWKLKCSKEWTPTP